MHSRTIKHFISLMSGKPTSSLKYKKKSVSVCREFALNVPLSSRCFYLTMQKAVNNSAAL